MTMCNKTTILGTRGFEFQTMILNVLSRSNLKSSYYRYILDDTAMSLYDQVFTHPTANMTKNYEYYEFIGDTTINKCVVWYLANKFPQLQTTKGVKVLTRMKINLISKKSFCRFAKILGFWDFVSASPDIKEKNMDKTLEDVFEAFFGLTETLINERISMGVGYSVCYSIMENLLNTIEISKKYEDLFDAKTRLKELFDHSKNDLGVLKYEAIRTLDSNNKNKHFVSVYNVVGGVPLKLGDGVSILKTDAEQFAAKEALAVLKKRNIFKVVPDEYIF